VTIGLIYAISALASAAGACLAWLAKLRWSKEFADAKEATIKAREDQIKSLESSVESVLKAKDAQIESLKSNAESVLKSKDAQIESLSSYSESIIKAKDAQIDVLQSQRANLRELSPMKLKEYVEASKDLLEKYIDQLKNQLKDANASIDAKEVEIQALQGKGFTQQAEILRLKDEKAKLETTTSTLASQVKEFERDEQVNPNLLESIKSSSNALSELVPASRPHFSIDDSLFNTPLSKFALATLTSPTAGLMLAHLAKLALKQESRSDEKKGDEGDKTHGRDTALPRDASV
jgi:hypothetical protein